MVAIAIIGCAHGYSQSTLSDDVAADILSNLDTTTNPCDDFYQYSCGGWIKNHVMDADKTRYTRSFTGIDEANDKVMDEIIAEVESATDDPDAEKVSNWFKSCMDTDTMDSKGLAPAQPYLNLVEDFEDKSKLSELMADLDDVGVGAFVGIGAEGDTKGTTPIKYTIGVGQGGLGLRGRDYYLDNSTDGMALLADYKAHISEVFTLFGYTDGGERAASVCDFETSLAKIQMSNVAQRDPELTYNKMDLQGISELCPAFDWKLLFTRGMAASEDDMSQIIVGPYNYLQVLPALLADTDVSVLKDYFRWHTMNRFNAILTSEFRQLHFKFYGTRMMGQKEEKPRKKLCTGSLGALGFLLGKFYIEKAFPGNSKEQVDELVSDIEAAFAKNLKTLPWMDEDAKTDAHTKMTQVMNKVGYPTDWENYDDVEVSVDDYFGNRLSVLKHAQKKEQRRLGNEVDRAEWHMTPSTINAYYDPVTNTINFPAGIVQPPLFSANFPAPMNYGGIGMIMGHELIHGFDDQGAQYDGLGQLKQWWSNETVASFKMETQCISSQYSVYEALPTVFVNGELTLGENIADNGGMAQSFSAWKDWEARQDEAVPEYFAEHNSDITNDQLFFIAFAQGWCTQMTNESLKVQVTNDPHSPAKFRVNGPLQNLPSFTEAFSCSANTYMNADNKCSIWGGAAEDSTPEMMLLETNAHTKTSRASARFAKKAALPMHTRAAGRHRVPNTCYEEDCEYAGPASPCCA